MTAVIERHNQRKSQITVFPEFNFSVSADVETLDDKKAEHDYNREPEFPALRIRFNNCSDAGNSNCYKCGIMRLQFGFFVIVQTLSPLNFPKIPYRQLILPY